MKRPSAVVVLVVAGVTGLIALLAYGVASESNNKDVTGESAPDISLPPLEGGEEQSLADFRGQVVVLNYWASWCKPCRQESPLLDRWHQKISKRDATVLGVDVLDVTSDALDFVDKYELTYPQLRDKDGATLDDLGITGYPETFVIDRDGRIVSHAVGEVDDNFLSNAVTPLLREN